MTLSTRFSFPKLRAIEVRPHLQNGHPYFLLRDPLALSDGSLLVPQQLGPVLALCDGSLENAQAIASALTLRYNAGVEIALIEELLTALDEACLLENERMDEALQRKREAYRSLPFRPATLAGLSYPAEEKALAQRFEDYLAQTGRRSSLRRSTNGNHNGHGAANYAGVFSPHIDYPRGGVVYAHTWGAVEEAAQAADLVILVGTDHYGDDLFTLTRQNYATPYGVLPTDTAIVDALATALGEEAAYAGELRHCSEHSLELVAVWLHHMRRGRPVDVVPVLCGSFYRFYGNEQSPASHPPVRTFLETLGRHMTGRRVLVVASGDLAHVGPAFGGTPLTTQDRMQVQSADRTLIDLLCAGDAEGFFNAIRRIRNRHNVCGGSPGYLALKLMGTVRGQEMAYQSCPADELNTSAVTICGVTFTS